MYVQRHSIINSYHTRHVKLVRCGSRRPKQVSYISAGHSFVRRPVRSEAFRREQDNDEIYRDNIRTIIPLIMFPTTIQRTRRGAINELPKLMTTHRRNYINQQ